MARDYGFAPNPFFGYCTLATCKPRIREKAKSNDWVIGTGSGAKGRGSHLVYAMRVTEAMSFDDYWGDPRFLAKRPSLRGSKKQAFGDNIYHRDKVGRWRQEDSHHSLSDGRPNALNVTHDTQVNRVLISDDFVYWGGDGPAIPPRFRNCGGIDLRAGRGHKQKVFSEKMITELIAWLRSRNESGYCGIPLDWSRSP